MATAVRLEHSKPVTVPHGAPTPIAPRPSTGRAATGAALAVTLLAAASALMPGAAVEVVGTGASALTAARLVRPAAYVALAPACDVYDALSLLTIRQHLAVLAWLAVAFVVARLSRARRPDVAHRGLTRGRLAREARAAVLAALAVVAMYAAGALLWRPMVALSLADADELSVDVHSHTSASHDGRWRFDAAHDRAWHHDAGFAAAYVTDHREYAGAEAGAAGNPAHAGLGTVLLPGIETRVGNEHVNLLGARAADSLDRDGWLAVGRLRAMRARGVDARPLVVLTAPVAYLDRLPRYLPIDAVEVVDAAPRGLAFTRTHRAAIVAAARGRGASLVAGADLHGWGRTAAAWTVVRVPGWRAMTPDSLDVRLRAALRDGRRVRVIARTAPPPPFTVAAWLRTPPAVVWHLFAVAGGAERLSWVVWAWALWACGVLARRRRGAGAARVSVAAPTLPAAA